MSKINQIKIILIWIAQIRHFTLKFIEMFQKIKFNLIHNKQGEVETTSFCSWNIWILPILQVRIGLGVYYFLCTWGTISVSELSCFSKYIHINWSRKIVGKKVNFQQSCLLAITNLRLFLWNDWNFQELKKSNKTKRDFFF